jgi:predicted  nucleic acid-binding Zn-ribbon protein
MMKFHCRCGKRISVPFKAKKTIGRCPKCGARLVVPKASDAKSTDADAPKKASAKPAPDRRKKEAKKKPRPEKADPDKARSEEARAENVRRAKAEVADRLRKRGSKGGKGVAAVPSR